MASAAPAARSYSKIRFSGKVGGVVIGALPQAGGDAPDIRQLEWHIAANALYLTLTDVDGHQVKLGPYSPAIAHHALAYAADGRVVTSTLPKPQQSRSEDIKIPARRVLG